MCLDCVCDVFDKFIKAVVGVDQPIKVLSMSIQLYRKNV